ncbi:MAG: ribonuclease P protein component [Patescibacteria group bacterium]
MALARKYRVVSDKDFNHAFRFGRAVSSRNGTLKIISNNLGYLRFGVAVSTKKFPLAVTRNKIKRAVFSKATKFIKDSRLGYDIIIVAQTNQEDGINDLEKMISKTIAGIKPNPQQ